METKESWAKEILKNQVIYPDTMVTRWVGRNFKDIKINNGKKMIDIGCGSGRHMKLFKDYGFDVYGIDYNQECLNFANEFFGIDCQNLEKVDLRDINYEFKFDIALIWGTIFFKSVNEVEKDLKSINNALKTNGKILIDFRTKEDWLFELGEKISTNTYVLDERAKEYKGITYSFFDLEEIKDLLNKTGFKINSIERNDYWKNNLEQKNSWLIIDAEKIT